MAFKTESAPEPALASSIPTSEMGPIRKTGSWRSRNKDSSMPKDADTVLRDILTHRGWEQREGQTQMTETIDAAIHDGNRWSDVDVAVNAPVGTGKTLAYLVAGVVNGQRIVIATSTKSLQDQIVQDELPKLAQDLKELYDYELTYGVLKGKSNYACSATVDSMLSATKSADNTDTVLFSDIDLTPDTRDITTLQRIKDRMTDARATGNVLEYDCEHLLAALTPGTAQAVRASKRCGGKSEPWVDSDEISLNDSQDFDEVMFDEGASEDEVNSGILGDGLSEVAEKVAEESACIYRAAYGRAMASQVVVVNTTLLIFEMLRAISPMGGEYKPSIMRGVGLVIIDEAHHLFENISSAYSLMLNFDNMVKDAEAVAKRLNKRYADDERGRQLRPYDKIVEIIRDAESDINEMTADYEEYRDWKGRGRKPARYDEHDWREEVAKRLQTMATHVQAWVRTTMITAATYEKAHPSDAKLNQFGIPKTIASVLYDVTESMDDALSISGKIRAGAVKEGEPSEYYNDFTTSPWDPENKDRMISLSTVPIDVRFFRSDLSQASHMVNPFTPVREDTRSVAVLSSGTITENTPVVVGMKDTTYLDVDTPFDPLKVRVCVPYTYSVSDPRWRDDVWGGVMLPTIHAVGGRTLSLHTAVNRMNEFVAFAKRDLAPEGYTILFQGNGMSKAQLINAMKSGEKVVLFGTRSFMEGVDIPGHALSHVIVDKIPFPQPDDPTFRARRKFVLSQFSEDERDTRSAQSTAFMKVDVDYASVMLTQITGRLIRSVDDVGGITILDNRILNAGYASKLTKLLPAEWGVTRSVPEYLKWLKWVNPETRGDMPMPLPDYRDTRHDEEGNILWRPLRRPKIEKPSGEHGRPRRSIRSRHSD